MGIAIDQCITSIYEAQRGPYIQKVSELLEDLNSVDMNEFKSPNSFSNLQAKMKEVCGFELTDINLKHMCKGLISGFIVRTVNL